LKCIVDLTKSWMPKSKVEWSVSLSELASFITNQVVQTYVDNNALKRLKTDASRRRVAASALHAVHYAKMAGEVAKPKFFGLKDNTEHACAFALVETNVEIRKGGVSTFVNDDIKCSVLMTPALVIVVCALLGVKAQILSDFKVLELGTALHLAGKQVINFIDEYKAERDAASSHVQSDQVEALKKAIKKLDDSLDSIKVYQMSRKVPRSKQTDTKMYFPILGTAICINKDVSPFADVWMQYKMYQLKDAEEGEVVNVDLWDETSKCGVLMYDGSSGDSLDGKVAKKKTAKKEAPKKTKGKRKTEMQAAGKDVVDKELAPFKPLMLAGFHAVWEGVITHQIQLQELTKKQDDPMAKSEAEMSEREAKLLSSAIYPFNLIRSTKVTESIPYLECNRVDSTWSVDGIDVTDKVNEATQWKKITFVITTNAKRIRLHGQREPGVMWKLFSIYKTDLDENGCINPLKLAQDEKTMAPSRADQWANFTKYVDAENFDMQFLFTD
jgi:hypothetical protein